MYVASIELFASNMRFDAEIIRSFVEGRLMDANHVHHNSLLRQNNLELEFTHVKVKNWSTYRSIGPPLQGSDKVQRMIHSVSFIQIQCNINRCEIENKFAWKKYSRDFEVIVI